MPRPKAHEEPHDPWEDGDYGKSEKHVKVAPKADEDALDEALELQMISIRLQKELIAEMKFIAKYHRIGYQPLVRDVLGRFARAEMLKIAEESHRRMKAEESKAAKRA